MKEIWELTISPGVLPFSILLIPVACYWLLCLVGIADIDMLDVDFDTDGNTSLEMDGGDALEVDGDASNSAHSGGFLHSVMNFFNATDVPVMLVVSLLILFLWAFAMLGHMTMPVFGPSIIALGALVVALAATKIVTMPLKPIFQKLHEEDHDPVIGKVATVRTSTVDEKGGQITLEHRGTTNYLNACVSAGSDAILKNREVIIYGHNKETGLYLVKEMPTER